MPVKKHLIIAAQVLATSVRGGRTAPLPDDAGAATGE